MLMRLLLSTILVACFVYATDSQVILFEDFNNTGGSPPAGWTTIDGDLGIPDPNLGWGTAPTAWQIREDFDTTGMNDSVAVSTSWYNPVVQCDDWLITPQIMLGSSSEVRWQAKAQDPGYPDGYELRISTSTPTIPGFNANPALFTIAAENSTTTSRTVNLATAGYSNQNVYLAWRNISTDEFVLVIDNVLVQQNLQFDGGITSVVSTGEYTQLPLSQNPSHTPSGVVKNLGSSTITNVELEVDVWINGASTQMLTTTIVPSLMPGDSSVFTFPVYNYPQAGDYQFNYILTIAENDQVVSNDIDGTAMIITDSTMARDDGQITGTLGIGANNGGYLGNAFTPLQTDELTSVQFVMTNGDQRHVGRNYHAEIFDFNAGIPNNMIGSTDTVAGDTSQLLVFNLPISGGPLTLTGGSEYLIAVIEADTTQTLAITNTIFTPMTTWIDWPTNPFQPWANNEDFGFSMSYVLRGNFGCALEITSDLITQPRCNGDANGAVLINVDGGSALTYLWSNGHTTDNNIGLTAGTYTVTVTEPAVPGCAITASYTVTDPPVFSATAASTDETCGGCNDGTATATPAGGVPPYSYNWSNGGNTQMIMSLSPGTYFVTVFDDNQCQRKDTVTVGAACALAIDSIFGIGSDCPSASTGFAEVFVSGVTSPTYSWSNGGSMSSISGLSGGTYMVTVTDPNIPGCSATSTVTITDPPDFSISISTTDESCAGCADGSATINISGGTPPYSFTWPNGDTTFTSSGLSAGSYYMNFVDANGCGGAEAFTIGGPTSIWDPGNTLPADVQIDIYPNPSSGVFSVSCNLIVNESLQLCVFDLVGEKVFSRTLDPEIMIDEQLDLTSHSAGVYIIRLMGENFTISREIIIE